MPGIISILRSKAKPKEKLAALVEAVCGGTISAADFIGFFRSASDVDKGTCAGAMKHISETNPELLSPYIGVLIDHISYGAPRVVWGVQEAIGNLSRKFPGEAAEAVPHLLKNTVENETATTVIRWCAAYALSEIAKHDAASGKKLVSRLKAIAGKEKNNGVRNVYLKALRRIDNH